MKKKLKWAIIPAIALLLGTSLSSFTGQGESDGFRQYTMSCPDPYGYLKITVCGQGNDIICLMAGTCP